MRRAAGLFALTLSPAWAVLPDHAFPPSCEVDTRRPAPLSDAEKARVLSKLPSAGEVCPQGPQQCARLAAIDRVLHFHQRLGVYQVKVIDVAPASTFLYARAALLVSLPALTLLDAEELQGLAAHEVGHEYVWDEFEDAQCRGDTERLRELELVCDQVASATLATLGVSPTRLAAALEKVERFNRARLGPPTNSRAYPTLAERRAVIDTMTVCARLAAGPADTSPARETAPPPELSTLPRPAGPGHTVLPRAPRIGPL